MAMDDDGTSAPANTSSIDAYIQQLYQQQPPQVADPILSYYHYQQPPQVADPNLIELLNSYHQQPPQVADPNLSYYYKQPPQVAIGADYLGQQGQLGGPMQSNFNPGAAYGLASQGMPEQPIDPVMSNMSVQPVTGVQSLTDILQGKYISNLGRPADPSGLAYWTQQIQSGQITPDQIDAIFAASPEGALRGQTGLSYDANAVNAVNAAYKGELGRNTDQAGFNYWLNQVQNGQMSADKLGQAFSNTPEGLKFDIGALIGGPTGTGANYIDPAVKANMDLLNTDYQKYLYRAPDQAGAQYWNQQLQSGAIKQSDLDKIFTSSPEGVKVKQIQDTYQSLLGHGADPAGIANWIGKLGTSATLADIMAALKNTDEYKKLHPINTGGGGGTFVVGQNTSTTQSGATTTAGQPRTATLDQLNQEAAATGMGRRFTPAEMDAFYSYGQRPEHVFYKPVEQTTTTTKTE